VLTPANLVVLARSPVVGFDGTPSVHNASIYTAPSGAWVFAAGTIQWSWGLAGGSEARASPTRPSSA